MKYSFKAISQTLFLCSAFLFNACAQNNHQSTKITTKMDKMEQYAAAKHLSEPLLAQDVFGV